MRSVVLIVALLSTSVLVPRSARADVLPPPRGGDAAYDACLESEDGSCTTEDGAGGTCVVVRGGPYGKPWDRLVCLSPAERARGRREGWVVERSLGPNASPWLWLAGAGLLAFLLREFARRLGEDRTPAFRE
jgi:hypothetical protein